MSEFPHLFSPLDIGHLTARNRVVSSTHSKLYGQNGTDSQRTIDYYVERAKGGTGIIFSDAWIVHPSSALGLARRNWSHRLAESPEVNRRLTAAVRAEGALIFTQIGHNGVISVADSGDDLRATWAPSAIRSPLGTDTPKEMEQGDIDELIEAFAEAAQTCRDVGYDGIEVHLAHGYLLHEFLSPVYNKRHDDYGGSWENRTRLVREILAAIRQRAGNDWVVGVRLSATDYIPGGLDSGDASRLASDLAAGGDVSFINVTGGEYHDPSRMNAPSDIDDGYFVDFAGEIRAAAGGLPVFVVGGIRYPEHAEKIIADGKADAVAMARAMLADPEWANKASSGRAREIVHCIRGNQGCMSRMMRGYPAGCTVNPAAGREARLGAATLAAAAEPGEWLVAGAGPAGMRAAATLARRGHEVTLLERSDRPGGQVNLILKTPRRETFRSVIDDLVVSLETAGVKVEYGIKATVDSVRASGIRNVVVATGAVPSRTGFSWVNPMADRLPGAEAENVLTPWDVLLEQRPVGKRAVVLDDDGTRYSAGLVEVLLERGCEVEVITPFSALFPDTTTTIDMPQVYQHVLGMGVRSRVNSWAREIGSDGVTALNLYTGGTELVPADSVVLCTARSADDSLYTALLAADAGLSVHRAGDCVAPRRIDHAIYEGELAGRELWTTAQRTIWDGDLERLRDPERM